MIRYCQGAYGNKNMLLFVARKNHELVGGSLGNLTFYIKNVYPLCDEGSE